MHKEILTKGQIELLPLVKEFKSKFYMVGGTAIALHIGHRRSVDFDLFSEEKFQNLRIRKMFGHFVKKEKMLVDRPGELTILLHDIKFTFFNFPYNISHPEKFDGVISMPDLLTLAAMKAFALGGRAKWKDYVDLYFILKKFHTLDEIIKKTKAIFGTAFNDKLFSVQLSYFEDVNYDEKVEYTPGFEVSDEVVKRELKKFSLS
ncbi:MAG: nucleotidyl transferase AbiEii/AbiGii toxin family protein [Candidatus Moranbacteria bacterium]|nr:nucleotidyl transferase AbiEii/AbiGii toxin family protein [Candidatus Moranbacteria bacterium]